MCSVFLGLTGSEKSAQAKKKISLTGWLHKKTLTLAAWKAMTGSKCSILKGKTEADEQINVFNKYGFEGLNSFLISSVEYE